MPTYEEKFAIRIMAILAASFTDIVGLALLPINCNFVTVFNNSGVAVLLRSDPGNASSEISIANGASFVIGASGPPRGSTRFPQNCNPVGSLKSSVGNVNVVIECSD